MNQARVDARVQPGFHRRHVGFKLSDVGFDLSAKLADLGLHEQHDRSRNAGDQNAAH